MARLLVGLEAHTLQILSKVLTFYASPTALVVGTFAAIRPASAWT